MTLSTVPDRIENLSGFIFRAERRVMKRPRGEYDLANGCGSTILTQVSAPRIASEPYPQGGGRVPALARTATVLQRICDAGRPMALAELARLTGLPKSSVMRICHALTEEHVLARGVDGTYALGSRVFEFGSAARAHSRPLRTIGFTYPLDESFFLAEVKALRSEATALERRLQLRSPRRTKTGSPSRSTSSSWPTLT